MKNVLISRSNCIRQQRQNQVNCAQRFLFTRTAREPYIALSLNLMMRSGTKHICYPMFPFIIFARKMHGHEHFAGWLGAVGATS